MCSGIGAPEVAAPWVDWRLASEIDPFPRAVLQERFGYRVPDDHNQGDPLLWDDMTEVTPALARSRGIPLPDLLVAGTPCQAFSIAGLRQGVSDARGNLTLKFVEICHAIVDARADGKLSVLWENVPGVLSDKGNAFGCFLAGLVGGSDPLLPPDGQGWPGAGMVSGPRARIAWRVLDAQYFGVPQRRRRLFVVVDFGKKTDPAAILFEPKTGGFHFKAMREAGEKPVGTVTTRTCLALGADDAGNGHLVICDPVEVSPGIFSNLRKMTPIECARLQGFEDEHCKIPWRGKRASACPDGPQYKALGNSMAVPCVAWILNRMRIQAGWAS
jgi:site-specific DNA-cytosine methylase